MHVVEGDVLKFGVSREELDEGDEIASWIRAQIKILEVAKARPRELVSPLYSQRVDRRGSAFE